LNKPHSDAYGRNRAPILAVLERVFADRHAVLEIGSGTGQHAVYFARALAHLVWQPSEVAENVPGIRLWIEDAGLPNLSYPIPLDVSDVAWPEVPVDAAFSANTFHIMAWPLVEKTIAGLARLLPAGGLFAVYGPFNYGGRHTSEGNARFDATLKARDPASGLRDVEAIAAAAGRAGFVPDEDNAMPANNRLLVFRKS
jgi:cyclopropane fatty-acyl-phospholipid synthase-like methyltransferase